MNDGINVAENIKAVKDNIKNACLECGRSTDDVTLICVSKTKPEEMIMEAYATGERNFGENYIQELTAKAESLPKDIIWHMIGPLQKNKVKKAVKYASVIHAVDSCELAEVIDKEAGKAGKIQDIMLEINTGNEESKHGFAFDDVTAAAEKIGKLENIRLTGLMCIPPFDAPEEETKEYFKMMRSKMDEINSLSIPGVSLTELSMGMSSDYPLAIKEGATCVRVGTGIFGARNYNK